MGFFQPIKHIAILLLCVATTSCSENYNSKQASLLKAEFEKTYQYTLMNMPIDTSQSYSFDELRNMNSAALISIAYRWHSYATDLCSSVDTPVIPSKKSSYEKLTDEKIFGDISITETSPSLQKCHSLAFFDNWSEIQKMISLNLSP